MISESDTNHHTRLFRELCKQPNESEWVEFKHNNSKLDEIGEYISALANSAALLGRDNAYMLWGVENGNHNIVGTKFRPSRKKKGSEELENWLLRLLEPQINFSFHELTVDDLPVVLLEVAAATQEPVHFKGQEYIRVGSYKKKLKDYPTKERELWRSFDRTPFEKRAAAENVSDDDVLLLLDHQAYFSLLDMPQPDTIDSILDALESDGMIARNDSGKWDVVNLGAILLARKLADFPGLWRKTVRVILYRNNSQTEALREQEGISGYACGYEELIGIIMEMLPHYEVIGPVFRKNVPIVPELAIRELVANMLIHQDFHQTGTGPMVEIFESRVALTNPGVPLVETERFLDAQPKSRNEAVASFMRRANLCEERGTGIDKAVLEIEGSQLPAPTFEKVGEHTQCTLFAHREFKDMGKHERMRAIYLHASLRYVRQNYMTNSSLRERFGLEAQNAAKATRIINNALEAGVIRQLDETASRKQMKYVPWWA